MPNPKFNSASAAPGNKAISTLPTPDNPIVVGPATGGIQNQVGLEPGTYKFTIRTVDYSGGITFHNFHVKVVSSLNTTSAVTQTFSSQLKGLNSGRYDVAFQDVLNPKVLKP